MATATPGTPWQRHRGAASGVGVAGAAASWSAHVAVVNPAAGVALALSGGTSRQGGFLVASKRHVRKKACPSSKMGHDSPEAAQAMIERFPAEPDLKVYRCQFCNRWHVGHHAETRRTRREHFR
jgi:hypothetical protein